MRTTSPRESGDLGCGTAGFRARRSGSLGADAARSAGAGLPLRTLIFDDRLKPPRQWSSCLYLGRFGASTHRPNNRSAPVASQDALGHATATVNWISEGRSDRRCSISRSFPEKRPFFWRQQNICPSAHQVQDFYSRIGQTRGGSCCSRTKRSQEARRDHPRRAKFTRKSSAWTYGGLQRDLARQRLTSRHGPGGRYRDT
jgi:hypothetical protein